MADDRDARIAQLEADVARLSSQLERSRDEASTARAEQAATAEVLRVIASSPTDLPQVLARLTTTAVRVCGADAGSLYQADGEEIVALASTHPSLIRER